MAFLNEYQWATFMKKVIVTEDCWFYTGFVNQAGYGIVSIDYVRYYTHRLSLQKSLGRQIADNMYALHSCRNRNCCNPTHLREGTPAENMLDKIKDGTSLKGELNPRAKLTLEQVVLIRNDERTCSKIATEYNVSKSLIKQIKKNKIWKLTET